MRNWTFRHFLTGNIDNIYDLANKGFNIFACWQLIGNVNNEVVFFFGIGDISDISIWRF